MRGVRGIQDDGAVHALRSRSPGYANSVPIIGAEMAMPKSIVTRCSIESNTSAFCMAESFLHRCMSCCMSSSTSKKRFVMFACSSFALEKPFDVDLKKKCYSLISIISHSSSSSPNTTHAASSFACCSLFSASSFRIFSQNFRMYARPASACGSLSSACRSLCAWPCFCKYWMNSCAFFESGAFSEALIGS